MLTRTTKSYTRHDKKSRVGCRLCKQKRIRCDETRPGCINCLRKGQVCPGYQVSLSWSTKHEQPNWKRSQRSSGPADFDKLANTASQAIHCGTKHGLNPNIGHTTPIANYDANFQLKQHNQVQAGVRKIPTTTHQYEEQTQPEAIIFPVGYYPSASTAVMPTIIDIELQRTTECCVDANLWASSAVTNDGRVVDVEYRTMSSPAMSSPTVCKDLESQLDQVMNLNLGAPSAGLLDLPTFLVQHWFGSVCRYWSAFDSEGNPFRSIAASLWGTSGVVFYSLQSMSAAALVEYMPETRDIMSSAPTMAIEAISEELTVLYTSDSSITQLPKGLILGLFCMASSMCWKDPQKTGMNFFRQARRLLRHFKLRREIMSKEDRQLLRFFDGCMKYEEMLRDVTGEGERDASRKVLPGEAHERRLCLKPHAWTGVSPDLLGLFGYAILLCREECLRRQGQRITRESLSQALNAIDEAQALEEALLIEPTAIEPDDRQSINDTRLAHLHDSTEGYRIAALLQLYQTFPDLVSRRIPKEVGPDGLVPTHIWSMPLALHLITILQRIPPSSDLRCIQPLLYISAGSCLRYDDISASSTHMSCISGDVGISTAGAPESLTYLSSLTSLFQMEPPSTSTLLNISSARRLVMERLGQLEQVLPPKPIRVAQQLMKATWEVFDNEIYARRQTHWLDVMALTGIKTLFG